MKFEARVVQQTLTVNGQVMIEVHYEHEGYCRSLSFPIDPKKLSDFPLGRSINMYFAIETLYTFQEAYDQIEEIWS
jgi:hypothetical protein